jgi:DNA topoisomerase-1
MREPGISRKKWVVTKNKKKTYRFEFYGPNGKRITRKEVVERCTALVLPPAWEDVWISEDPHASLQATGKDLKGRLQYKYHAKWTEERSAEKFKGMAAFARLLPGIRKQVDEDMTREGMPKAKVVALIVKLIDLYHFRVGNDEYAKKNNSYGLTTMKKGHMSIDRSKGAEGKLDAVFEFVGKSGKLWKRRIWEDSLATLIDESGKFGNAGKRHDLFSYEDGNGVVYDIKAHHVNEYLDALTGANRVTAKDFRTWAATWKTAFRLSRQLDPDTITARKKVTREVIKTVASDLGNTPAVCVSSYIHPRILADWQEGRFREKWNRFSKNRKVNGLSKEETAVLHYLG